MPFIALHKSLDSVMLFIHPKVYRRVFICSFYYFVIKSDLIMEYIGVPENVMAIVQRNNDLFMKIKSNAISKKSIEILGICVLYVFILSYCQPRTF